MSLSNQGDISIDLNRFSSIFFEECTEHLAEMEQILVALDPSRPGKEELNALFRAAHSIKGGAGMFGFADLGILTHELETLLDRFRGQEIPLTQELINLFLEARDVIALQLRAHRDGETVSAELVETVRLRLGEHAVHDPGELSGKPDPWTVDISAALSGDVFAQRLEILFTPAEDLFLRGVRVEQLFRELSSLGRLTVTAILSDDHHFHAADPEQCALSWRMELETAASEEEVREIFEFVAEQEQLRINPLEYTHDLCFMSPSPTGSPPAAAAEGEPPGTADAGMGGGRRAYDRKETAPGVFGRRGGDGFESSIRVGVNKVDQLINQVGELVITQAMLTQMATVLDPVLFENIHRGFLQLERNTRDLQQSVMSIRLVPISMVFSRFPRLVHDLSHKLGKQVELRTVGETTELDKGLIEKISDPLTHLVRNCLDHGMESPETRVAAGKPPCGTVTLRASQVGGRIVIDVMDDGAGLNREKILAKACERGIPAHEGMTDDEVWQLIFAPGFSTADAVTDLSGRGVGMDVVQKNVQALSGRVQISSEHGQGTRVTISLPLTLAILDGLSVRVGEEKFILPLNSIVESLQLQPDGISTVSGQRVVHVRGEYIQLLPLHELFSIESAATEPSRGIVVLVDVEGERAALLVDALLDEHQVVIKSLETNYRKVEGTAGATILGDGKVALILDIATLIQLGRRRPGH